MWKYLACIMGLWAGLLLPWGSAAAQAPGDDSPLGAPLLAINTVERDAVLLYDLAADRYRRLAFGLRGHHVWDFAPDGCSLLLTLQESERFGQMYRASLDGTRLTPLVQYDELPADRWGVWEPQWSPDGTRIAFNMLREQRQPDGTLLQESHIGWVPPEGGVPTFYSVTGREFSPQWSPDGAWLAYVSYDERIPGADVFSTAVPTTEPLAGQTPAPLPAPVNEADLWVVSADGETKYRLTDFRTGSVSMPRWSPDSELISFVYSPSGNNDMFWMIANAPEAIPTQLSNQWSLILDTTWLPDSTRIIGAVRDFRDVMENRLWEIPLVGLADEDAVQYRPELGLSYADYPRFSPSGERLVVRSAYELVVADLTAGTTRTLAEQTFGNTPAIWSPAAYTGEQACER